MKNLMLCLGFLFGLNLAHAGGGSTVGPANPASLFCIEREATLVIVEDDLGQTGYCNFKGAFIEEWTFWREKNGDPTTAVRVFLTTRNESSEVRLPNPAAKRCEDLGGTYEIKTPALGSEGEIPSQFSVCRFPDNSLIEAWTLFRGANSPSNADLVSALLKP